MQSTGILVAILAGTLAASAVCTAAQSTTADAEAQARAAQQNAVTDRYLTAVQVELAGKVDTKNAVVGQEVSARTLAEARLADGTPLPKGTRMVGRVMQVRAGGQQAGLAVLALTFDRAELQGGKSIAVRSVIRTVAPVGNAAATASTFSDPMAPMSTSNGAGSSGHTATRVGAGVGGVGLPGATRAPGGATGATLPSIDEPIGGTPAGAGGTMPSITDPAGSTIGGAAANTRSLEGTTSAAADRRVVDAGERTSPAARATAMPGVMLSNTAVANASGTLTAFGRNISLESGTQITLGVITR